MAVHVEWIYPRSFDEKFKNALRDYYSYGFKNYDSYWAGHGQTLAEDWKRLNNILGDYLEWSEDPEQVMFASLDSQSAEENVFQRVYRFCGFLEKDPAYFFHALAALSPDLFLRDGIPALELEKRDRIVRSGKKKIWRKFDPWGEDEEFRMRLEEDVERGGSLTTADFLCFYPDGMPIFSGENRKTNLRLQELADLGFLRCAQQVEKGNRRWLLSRRNLAGLLEGGRQVHPDFAEHFQQMLDFYSRYMLLGELGRFLLDRMDVDAASPFRFKHEYDIQALNDFNLADLLDAMEENRWCLIRYRHGISAAQAEVLCYPLEIRVSAGNGRESLMYYDPFLRSYSSLRLEFMDSIESLLWEKVVEILHVPAELLEGDIAYAARALRHTWGLSTTPEQRGNAIPGEEKMQQVRMRILYTPKTEQYVRDRMVRGRRVGRAQADGENLEFTVQVTDTSELRPWVRSFYSRLWECEGMDTPQFSVARDIQDMAEAFQDGKLSRRMPHSSPWFPREIPVLYAPQLHREAEPARQHERVFHSAFSAYYHVMARVFARLCGQRENCLGEEELQQMTGEALGDYCHMIGMKTEDFLPGQIGNMLKTQGFSSPATVTGGGKKNASIFSQERPGYRLKYGSRRPLEFYRDVVPLSQMELRWLRSLLEDERIGAFLEDSEQAYLLRFLREDPAVSPLPFRRVVFFDRSAYPREQLEAENRAAKGLLAAIRRRQEVQVEYCSMKGKRIDGVFRPLTLEFSKRDNRFRGYLQSCRDGEIYQMNLSGVRQVEPAGGTFDYPKAMDALDQYRARQERSVEIAFFDVRNLADRVLTEFTPWKKRCVYEKSTGLYRLTLFYQKVDEKEMVIRLMGYGADLLVTDQEHPIYREIQARVYQQMKILEQQRRPERRGRPRKKRQKERDGG